MKNKQKKLFSISKKESEYFNDKQDYIELVDCPKSGIRCVEHRKVINENMLSHRRHLINKNYFQSIEKLRAAFYKTNDLRKAQCENCAKLFRSAILHSMENMHHDLRSMSSGIFTRKRHKPSFEFASKVLEELKRDAQ